MADFTESMKAFTDRLMSSIDERGESLANTHQATTDLLNAARMFMNDVATEHEARAASVNEFMAKSHADRAETVQAMRDMHRDDLAAMSAEMRRMLDEDVKSRTEYVADFMATSHTNRCETARLMRDNHREELAAMRDELHHTLEAANKTRLETVGAMRKTFQDARSALSSDLRAASTTWRQFASGRHQMTSRPAPTPEPQPEPIVEVAATASRASHSRMAAPAMETAKESTPDRPKARRGAQPHRTARSRASS